MWDPEHRSFLGEHVWAILATGRRDGSPQQSMVGYAVDDEGCLLISVKSYPCLFYTFDAAADLTRSGLVCSRIAN